MKLSEELSKLYKITSALNNKGKKHVVNTIQKVVQARFALAQKLHSRMH